MTVFTGFTVTLLEHTVMGPVGKKLLNGCKHGSSLRETGNHTKRWVRASTAKTENMLRENISQKKLFTS